MTRQIQPGRQRFRGRGLPVWGMLLAAVQISGCLLDAPDVGPPIAGRCNPVDSNTDQDVSFAVEILPIFRRDNAPGCSCHQPSDGFRPGFELTGLDLSSYESLLRGGTNSGGQIVVPGSPCDSILVQKIGDAPPFGSRMPLSGPPYLTDRERQVIADWIAEGARDN